MTEASDNEIKVKTKTQTDGITKTVFVPNENTESPNTGVIVEMWKAIHPQTREAFKGTSVNVSLVKRPDANIADLLDQTDEISNQNLQVSWKSSSENHIIPVFEAPAQGIELNDQEGVVKYGEDERLGTLLARLGSLSTIGDDLAERVADEIDVQAEALKQETAEALAAANTQGTGTFTSNTRNQAGQQSNRAIE